MSTKFAPVAALFETDAYKLGHVDQYALSGNVTRVYSNYTNRKSRLPGVDKVVHFGLQAYIAKHLMEAFEPFFATHENTVAALYEERVAQILGPDAAYSIGSDHIRQLHRLGFLPLRFCAVPEGTLVPIGVPSFTVENTHESFYWLTNYIETGLSAGVWQASTSATIAKQYRRVLEAAALRTGSDLAGVDWQCHDFSYRGMSSHESAAASGAAHLLSFTGTDSLVSLDWIDRYYGGDYVAGSVPATEHSVMCTGIETVGELETFRRLLDLYPTGIVSVVSDTFDLWKVLTTYLPTLYKQIVGRDGKLVIRPDSGDPETIICGDETKPMGSPAGMGVLGLLYEHFGGKKNPAGFIELDPHVGVIYGDSITIERAERITRRMERLGYASSNVVFGVGSYTYQYNTRDTFGSAMKATWAEVDGKGYNLLKNPVTDDGTKKSATGRLAVLENIWGDLALKQNASIEDEKASLLRPVWENGKFLGRQSFAQVRDVLARQS
ncbi:nicotinamide phosphoribosyl transferase [Mycobacterium phage MS810]|uniref:nicotinamide phosphoribosyl transferase n=1 Tax=Mycobacterium phage Crossroads TaxID=1340836 RepID=UPI0003880AA7|nr:nicotinamide phosphoribosyl transferase [Mycobacterium phage Crossroads]AOT23065.1 nicotinate ribosyltransferase [Mycobacterium phage Wilder]QDK03874.1 nicotinate ribosyltransferase [Mycobacterium phage Lewan]QGJ96384.1 nicotinate ribosyltransferase [Mycobacterium phage Kahlid]UJQ87083.1 nicotinate ribosyltransferase [Mycobacterium phage Vetrix]AGT13074.1 nicotinate ribosyltransferase [Mycobacterium phage Crossroads]